ncbi:MAG TPA: hypothetical protein VGZ22_11975 [Isosphaeraceae bacterium]|jgi:translocation and assembly module TamB|nr:hypothetical protein [Isosphaeraceae bacterium]
MPNPAPARKHGRWWKVLTVVAILVLATMASVPWLLSTPPGRRWVLARVERAMAPGKLGLTTLRLSWFGPTEMTGFVLFDHQGDRVVVAPRATWHRNFWQILFARPRLGTLELTHAALDVERSETGAIDLFETIKPVISKNPETDLTILVHNGTLRFRSPGLAQPVQAERADVMIALPASPRSFTWRLRLSNGAGAQAEALQVEGSYDRWKEKPGTRPDLSVVISGERWPLALNVAGVQVNGRWQGKAQARQTTGLWSLEGSATIEGLDATAPAFAGDHLGLDRIAGTWDLAQTGDGWSIRRLDVSSPLGELKATGALPAPGSAFGSAHIEGQLDLAAMARQLPHALRLREGLTFDRGSAKLVVDAKTSEGRQTWDLSAHVSDLIARDADRTITLRQPATLTARIVQQAATVRIDELGLKTAFLDVSAQGDFDRGVALAGSVDLAGLRAQLQDFVDLGNLELAGAGKLTGQYRRAGETYEGSLSADFNGLRLASVLPIAVEQDALHIETAVSGAADSSGWPQSWSNARLALTSGEASAEVKAIERDGATDLDATLLAPLKLADRDARAEGRLTARWQAQAVAISEAKLTLRPAKDDHPDAEPIIIAARGRFDSGEGRLVLEPVAGSKPAAIALAPEGLHIAGLGRAETTLRAEGAVTGDVAALNQALASWAGWKSRDLGGSWTLRGSARGSDEGVHLSAQLEVRDLSGPRGDEGGRWTERPVSLTMRALYHSDADRIDLAELVLASPYATLDASGQLSGLRGQRLIDLRGSFRPGNDAINAFLAASVEPQAHLVARPRAFFVKGPLVGESTTELLKNLDAELGFDLVEADLYGMKLGPTPIALRTSDQGKLLLAPIQTTLNNGALQLDGELDLNAEQGVTLRINRGASLKDAEVNSEVSRRVLAYVAPILQDATRTSGYVSAAIDKAEFPLVGDARRKAVVEGQVVFRDVTFAPGPLADDLITLLGITNVPSLKLNQPVTLAIADGKVIQRGLAIPLGKLSQIEIAGTVDFDRNLDLTASLPITPTMLGNVPVLTDILGGTRITVPIRGTLSKPRLDRDAMAANLKQNLGNIGGRAVAEGLTSMFNRLTRPREPEVPRPPRMTPQERRQQRLEKKAERRRQRQMDR